MKYNRWDDQQIKKLKKHMLTDNFSNEILNMNELAHIFHISKHTMEERICRLIKTGKLPPRRPENRIDTYGRPFNETEDKRIIYLSTRGYTSQEIGNLLDRPKKSIDARRQRLARHGFMRSPNKHWTPEEDQQLIAGFRQDQHGINTNVHELVISLNRSQASIEHRICRLRQQGKLPRVDRRGASDPGVERWLKKRKEILNWIYTRA